MRHTISRETPIISKLGNDEPTPMLCYEKYSLLGAKSFTNFKKQVSRPQLILVKSASVDFVEPSNTGIDGQGFGLASHLKGVETVKMN